MSFQRASIDLLLRIVMMSMLSGLDFGWKHTHKQGPAVDVIPVLTPINSPQSPSVSPRSLFVFFQVSNFELTELEISSLSSV
jgi:hypothetical protein